MKAMGHLSLTQEERQQSTLREKPHPYNRCYATLQLVFNYFCQFHTIYNLYI